jgi:phosphoglycolate phosphatase
METHAVLFDLDGTLVDSLPGIEFSVDCCMEECGLASRQRPLRPLIGPPIRTILEEVAPGVTSEQLSQLERAFRQSYNSAGWRKTLLHAGAVDTLARLRTAGLPIFLVTNKPHVPTGQILEALGIGALFSDVLCRDSRTPAFESKAEMLRHVFSAHELDPAACLYVGDSIEDYRAAMEAGVPLALVGHGYGELQPGLPGCATLNSLSEVLNTIGILETA